VKDNIIIVRHSLISMILSIIRVSKAFIIKPFINLSLADPNKTVNNWLVL